MNATVANLIDLASRRAELHPLMDDHLPFLRASAAWFDGLTHVTADEIQAACDACNGGNTTRLYLAAAVTVSLEADASATFAKAADCWRRKVEENS